MYGLTPKSSETGETDRKGQPLTKAGPSRLRTSLILAADAARKQDPQLARIYYLQMTKRGASHVKALCVVAANLAERAWAVMQRGEPREGPSASRCRHAKPSAERAATRSIRPPQCLQAMRKWVLALPDEDLTPVARFLGPWTWSRRGPGP